METIKINLPGDADYFTEEAFKVLRTNIQFCGRDNKVIALTSCNENEGKTTVALHLAKSFAELGKKVLLIDVDMRKSVIAGRNTTVRRPRGLSEVLSGLCPVTDCLFKVEGYRMHMLFAGQYPPNPVELLSGKYFATLLEECRKAYDYVILDTPPLGQVIDAAVITERCDGAILVIGSQGAPYREAQEVVDKIKKSGCSMLGVVRNCTNPKDRKYYSHYGK